MEGSATTSDHAGEVTQDTETGLDENVAAALSYVLGLLTGLIFFLIETDNEYIRFHAAQSMVVFGVIFVGSMVTGFVGTAVGFIDVIGIFVGALIGFVNLVLMLGGFVLWIYLIVRTYQGRNPRIPIAATVADSLV